MGSCTSDEVDDEYHQSDRIYDFSCHGLSLAVSTENNLVYPERVVLPKNAVYPPTKARKSRKEMPEPTPIKKAIPGFPCF